MIITETVVNVLFLTQLAETNVKVLTVEHTVGIADAVAQNMMPQSPRSLLLLNQSVRLNYTKNLSVLDTIVLGDTPIPRENIESVSDLLYMWQDAQVLTQWPDLRQSVVLSHEVDVEIAKGVYDTLTLTQEVSVSYTRGLSVESQLQLVSEVTGYLPSRYWTAFDINVVEP